MALKRTGLRKPKHHLKTWGDASWTRQLTPRLWVGMVDEELPLSLNRAHESRTHRKSWYLSLTQNPDLFTTLGPVKGHPWKGKTLLLFEDDVVALMQHLFESHLITVDEHGTLLNGPEDEDRIAASFTRRKSAHRKRTT